MDVNHVVVVGGVNVDNMSDCKLRDYFICNRNRFICDCDKQLNYDDDSFPRKQIITCLGKYCDDPCRYQKLETDLTLEQAITLIKWTISELNNHLIKK